MKNRRQIFLYKTNPHSGVPEWGGSWRHDPESKNSAREHPDDAGLVLGPYFSKESLCR